LICDKDAVIAVAGVSKKEYMEKGVSDGLETVMQGRSVYRYSPEDKIYPTKEEGNNYVSCAMPIISEGDVIGCVVALSSDERKKDATATDVETKLIMTAANFLGKQMEA
jgi:AbrB family transcriptional regulator (stage V sporulation protein T)